MTRTPNSLTWGEDTHWERVARSSWGSYITEVEKRVILKANNLAQGTAATTALEVGCGGGRWSRLLVDLGWNVVCTDIDSYVLTICQRRISTAKCILVDKDDTSLPCETESLGLLLCIEVIEVLRNDWFITEAFRVLRRSGLVVGVFKNKLSLRGYFHHLVSSVRGGFDYYKLAYPGWRSRFCRHGFKMIHEEGICWFPFSRDSDSSLVPMFTQIERYLGLNRLPNTSPWIVFIAQKESSA